MTGKEKRVKEKTKPVADTSPLKKYWQYILIAIFGFALYVNSIPNDYSMDDELVTKSHKLTSQGIKAIPEIFTSSYYSDNMGYAYDYRPIVHVSFAIEHQLLGENPHISHLISVLLYILLCVLVYISLKQFVPLPDIALVAITLLFTAHPVHTEVVSSIKNRDELLAFIFGFSAFYASLKFYRNGKIIFPILVSLFFTLSLLSKQTASMMAVLIPISLVLFCNLSWKRLLIIQVLLSIPFFFLMNVTYLNKKILFTGIFLVFPYFILLVRDFSYFIILKNLILSFLKKITEQTEGSSSSGFSLTVFEGSTADTDKFSWKQLFYPSSFFVPLFLSAGMVYFMLRHDNIGFFVLLSVIAVLYFVGKPAIKWWSFVLSGITILANGYSRGIHFELLAGTLFIHWCVFHIIRYNLWFAIPSVLFFIVTQIFNRTNEFNAGFIIWGIALYAMRFRYGYIVTLIGLLLLIRDVLRDFSSSNILSSLQSSVYVALYIIPVGLLWFKKEITHFYKVVFVFVIVALFLEPGYYSGSAMHNPITNTEVNVLPLHVDRPIKYVESPVNLQDPLSLKLGTSFNVLARYLKLVLIPYPLSYYYGYSYIKAMEFLSPLSLISFLIHFFLAALALLFLRRNPIVSLGLLWYLISIAAFTSIVQTLPGMMGDRYLFCASLGFCILLTVVLMHMFKLKNIVSLKQVPQGLKYILASIIAIYSGITIARNNDWKDYITLFEHDIKNVDNSSQAHNLLALRYNQRASITNDPLQKKRDYEKGLYHFKRSLEIYPDFLNVNFDIGRTYLLLQMPDSALPYFKRAAIIDSNFIESYNKIGEILVMQKKSEEAIPYFQYVIKKRPELYMGYDRLSFLYFNKGDNEKSLAVNREAIRRITTSPEPYVNIGRTFRAMNQRDSALYYFEKANAISPGNAEVQNLISELRNK